MGVDRRAGSDSSSFPLERSRQHEAVAQECRHWVRLTRCCNNRCAFCLDELSAEQRIVPEAEVAAEITAGRQRGAARLILSGGEPTLHPGFVRLIRLGQQVGYRHIQAISNGRMFSYPDFLQRALAAGLDEITFSIHGHEAAVHDALVGVPGAFHQTERGILLALSSGRVVVSVDVCLNRHNIAHLPELLARFITLGVREFDLLHIIPFGRAFQQGRLELGFVMEEAHRPLQQVLALSQRSDLHIWFNRFPPPYLEGHEHLIQDPHKLHDEVRGRQEEFELLLSKGQPLRCRQPERCRHCYLQGLCDALEAFRGHLASGHFEALRIIATDTEMALPPPARSIPWRWVHAANAEMAKEALARLDADNARVILELEDYSHFFQQNLHADQRLARVYVSRPEDLDRLLARPDGFEVVAQLSRELAAHLLATYRRPPGRLVLARKNHPRSSESLRWDADLPAFFAEFTAPLAVEEVPACISGRPPRLPLLVLDANLLRRHADPLAGQLLDLVAFTDRYILDHCTSKSLRCQTCPDTAICRGVQLNYLRAHGYRTLQPRAPAP